MCGLVIMLGYNKMVRGDLLSCEMIDGVIIDGEGELTGMIAGFCNYLGWLLMLAILRSGRDAIHGGSCTGIEYCYAACIFLANLLSQTAFKLFKFYTIYK